MDVQKVLYNVILIFIIGCTVQFWENSGLPLEVLEVLTVPNTELLD